MAAHPDRTDLAPAPVPLPEGEAPQWVMIARTGRWEGHPQGPEVITAEHLRSALDHFRRHYQAHGADLPVDYHHASVAVPTRAAKAPAAGWIREMELRAEGSQLWGRLLWTVEGRREVQERKFRYLSPAFLFNAPDRVTGEPVPMVVHSLALTNTPFLTELHALNHQPAPAGGRSAEPNPTEGGESMTLMNALAQPLGKGPEEVATRLGLEADAEDTQVAGAVLAGAARLRELEERLAARREVTNALGIPEDAPAGEVRHALCSLKASLLAPVLNAVRERLGLPERADESTVLNAIDALRRERADREVAELVNGAVEAGRIPPSQRDFFMTCARSDAESTRECLNALPLIVTPARPGSSERAARPGRDLTGGELSVCRQLGLSAEAFLGAAD